MSTPFPPSTGLPDSGLGPKQQQRIAWRRQAAGIYRAAVRARFAPGVLAGRFYWLLGVQAVLTAVGAWAVSQAGLGRVTPEAAGFVSSGALLLLVLHVLWRMGGLLGDVLRDVDEQVLDSLEAGPLPSSAYVAGRLGFHLTEQAIGLAILLPAFALAHALRALDFGQLLALVLGLLAVSLTYGLACIDRVLRAHGRRARGAALAANQRPGAGGLVGIALLGAAAASGLWGWSLQGADWLTPGVLGLSLTPAMPLAWATGGPAFEIYGTAVPAWLAASLWLLAFAPLAAASSVLRWKAPVAASGASLRSAFALAWVVAALVPSGCWRSSSELAAAALLVVGGVGAILPAAWAAAHELGALGERPGARAGGWLAQRRRTAVAWALLLQAGTLVLLALLAPTATGVSRSDWLALAVVIVVGTTPALACSAALARVFVPGRASVIAVVLLAAIVAAGLGVLPQLCQALRAAPVVGPLFSALEAPASLLAAASPMVLLPEAASGLIGQLSPGYETWVDVPKPWNLGQPDWSCGIAVASLFGYPLAVLLSRWARARGR